MSRRKAATDGHPRESFVYFIAGAGKVKIGRSSAVVSRLLDLQVGSPVRLRLLAVISGGPALEADLHRQADRAEADERRQRQLQDIEAAIRRARKGRNNP
jgi:hypothetical protein